MIGCAWEHLRLKTYVHLFLESDRINIEWYFRFEGILHLFTWIFAIRTDILDFEDSKLHHAWGFNCIKFQRRYKERHLNSRVKLGNHSSKPCHSDSGPFLMQIARYTDRRTKCCNARTRLKISSPGYLQNNPRQGSRQSVDYKPHTKAVDIVWKRSRIPEVFDSKAVWEPKTHRQTTGMEPHHEYIQKTNRAVLMHMHRSNMDRSLLYERQMCGLNFPIEYKIYLYAKNYAINSGWRLACTRYRTANAQGQLGWHKPVGVMHRTKSWKCNMSN